MRQNLALSALIFLSLVPLAATGVLGLAAVVGIHEFAELLVIANGVRAARTTAFTRRTIALTDSATHLVAGRAQAA
jgi:cation-transporting P-type ATPase G